MVFHDDGLVTIVTCNEGSNRNVHPPMWIPTREPHESKISNSVSCLVEFYRSHKIDAIKIDSLVSKCGAYVRVCIRSNYIVYKQNDKLCAINKYFVYFEKFK